MEKWPIGGIFEQLIVSGAVQRRFQSRCAAGSSSGWNSRFGLEIVWSYSRLRCVDEWGSCTFAVTVSYHNAIGRWWTQISVTLECCCQGLRKLIRTITLKVFGYVAFTENCCLHIGHISRRYANCFDIFCVASSPFFFVTIAGASLLHVSSTFSGGMSAVFIIVLSKNSYKLHRWRVNQPRVNMSSDLICQV